MFLACKTSLAAPPSDAAWLRRAALDLTGRLPTLDQLARIEHAPGAATRAALVSALLASPDYPRRWGRLLAAPLIAGDRETGPLARRVGDFVTESLAARRGWHEVARELLTAEGSVDEAPATAFLLQFIATRSDVASRVGMGLMGVRLACAQCHDHPFARWTAADFHGLAACFARTRRLDVPRELYRLYREGRRADLTQVDVALPQGSATPALRARLARLGRSFALLNRHPIGGPPRQREDRPVQIELLGPPRETMPGTRVTDLEATVPVLVEEGAAELPRPDLPDTPATLAVTLPLQGKSRVVPPRLPAIGPLDARRGPRRVALAAWLTHPGNPYLTRALVNRVHAHLFGHALTEPDEGGRPGPGQGPGSTTAGSPEAGERIDIEPGLRPAPRSPSPAPVDDRDSAAHSRLDALAGACARERLDVAALLSRLVLSPEYLASAAVRPLDSDQITGALESGLGLADTAALARALARQARARADDATAETTRAPTALDLPAALTWIASPELDQALARSRLLKETERLPADRRLEALMRALLSRAPTAAERARFAAARGADAAWALIASAEFLTH